MTKTAQELADEAKWLVGEVISDFYRETLREHQLNTAIDALLSLAQASQARTDGGAVADTFERYAAIREGHYNGIVDEYFQARKDWTLMPHGIFKDGFYRGFDARDALATPPGNATQAAGAREPLTEEQMDAMYIKASAGVYRCRHDYYAGILDAEAAHGIASPAAELKKD